MQLFKEKEERQNQLKNTTSRQNITFLNFLVKKFARFKGIAYFCTQSYVIGTVPNGMKGVLKLSCFGIWTIPQQMDNEQGAHVSLIYVSPHWLFIYRVRRGLLFVAFAGQSRASKQKRQ